MKIRAALSYPARTEGGHGIFMLLHPSMNLKQHPLQAFQIISLHLLSPNIHPRDLPYVSDILQGIRVQHQKVRPMAGGEGS